MIRTRLSGEERRRQIMEVAAQLFADNGYHRTKTKQIAKAIGVAESVLYQYFNGKEEIFASTMMLVHTAMVERWWRIADEAENGLEALRRIHHDRVTESYSDIRHSANIYGMCLEGLRSEEISEWLKTNFIGAHENLQKLVMRGIEDGSIRDDVDPAQVVLVIRSISWFLHLPTLFGIHDYLPLDKALSQFDDYFDSLKP
jgi:AcrR family transcriptional regulator